MLRQFQKKLFKKLFLSRSGVTTCWKRRDNNVITEDNAKTISKKAF